MSLANRMPVPGLPAPAERKRLRELFGASQTEIARAVGANRRSVYGWERGTSEPAGEHRIKYAELLAAWAETERRVASGLQDDASLTGS